MARASSGRPLATALSRRISMRKYSGRATPNHSLPMWAETWRQEQDRITSHAVGGVGHRHIARSHTSHSTSGSSHAPGVTPIC